MNAVSMHPSLPWPGKGQPPGWKNGSHKICLEHSGHCAIGINFHACTCMHPLTVAPNASGPEVAAFAAANRDTQESWSSGVCRLRLATSTGQTTRRAPLWSSLEVGVYNSKRKRKGLHAHRANATGTTLVCDSLHSGLLSTAVKTLACIKIWLLF